jgi:hypothetical protein
MNKQIFALLVVATFPVITLCGCRNADDQVKQDAVIQGQENANAADHAEKAVALEMEHELARRQRLFQGLTGRFAGRILTSDSSYLHIEITLFPSVQPYRGERVRTREEIAHDLERLDFKVNLRAYAGSASHLACVFPSITPDETTGEILLASDACLYSISLRPTDDSTKKSSRAREAIGIQLTEQLFDGKIDRVPMLYFDAVSTKNGLRFQAGLERE